MKTGFKDPIGDIPGKTRKEAVILLMLGHIMELGIKIPLGELAILKRVFQRFHMDASIHCEWMMFL